MTDLVPPVQLLDNADEVVNGVGEDTQVSAHRVGLGDPLDMNVDVGKVSGNIWGDTAGAVWGHVPKA
jgi:hypothetical protein